AEGQFRAAEILIDSANAAIENAKSEVAIRNTKLNSAEAGLNTAKANIESAKLVLEKAHLAVARTKIVAPFEGVVTRRNASEGDYVLPERGGERAVFTLMRVDTVRVVAAVAVRDVPLIEVGVPAEVTIDALPNASLSGKVSRFGFALDPTNRTMRVEVDIPNA